MPRFVRTLACLGMLAVTACGQGAASQADPDGGGVVEGFCDGRPRLGYAAAAVGEFRALAGDDDPGTLGMSPATLLSGQISSGEARVFDPQSIPAERPERLGDAKLAAEQTLQMQRWAGFMRYVGALAASGLYVEAQGYYEAMTPVLEVFEGEPPPNRAVIIVRFPCIEKARAFWYSDEYAAIREIREGIAEFEVTLLRVPPYPAYMRE